MIPVIADLEMTLEDVKNSTKDFAINFSTGRISGFVDDLESVKQVCVLILNTERYDFPIYSWNYGVELKDLIGQPPSYVHSEVKRRITEALMQDDRITDVTDFEVNTGRHQIEVNFRVSTIYGDFQEEIEVEA